MGQRNIATILLMAAFGGEPATSSADTNVAPCSITDQFINCGVA